MTKPRVAIWTDGSCWPNDGTGPGGWGAVLEHPRSGACKELFGGLEKATNNRAELTAAIKALEALKRPCIVRLHTDSRYVMNGFAKGWVNKWRRQGWRTSQGKPVANQDLWEQLYILNKRHRIAWLWVRGHAGNVNNERADELALLGRKSIKGA